MNRLLLILTLISAHSFAQELKPKEKLGKLLFFDPILSGNNITSCATCHNPGLGFEDGLPTGIGTDHQILRRHVPTLINVSKNNFFFWDGRERNLQKQVEGPIENPQEMNQNLDDLVVELQDIKGYVELFSKVYPDRGITRNTITESIASFEKTLTIRNAPLLDYLNGNRDALQGQVKRGLIIFSSAKASCIDCHMLDRDLLTNNTFQDTGIISDDLGRGELFPNDPWTHHTFKVPNLWNIAKRAPYMHDGSQKTLKEVIEFYNRGGDSNRITKNPVIRPLKLTEQEKEDLLMFLEVALTGEVGLDNTIPELPRNH